MKNNQKVIFHIDMNAFFASCELIKRPYLADKPFAIGPRFTKKGVLSTANYVARKYGVSSAMNVSDALKKCPNLIIVEGNYHFYEECSNRFMKILSEYTPLILQASIDEAFLDVTSLNRDPLELAKEIQNRILNEAQLPSSIGIGPTLFLAKMGSDYKKPMGITLINKEDIKEKLYPLPIKDFFGIGLKSIPWFKERGINTIGDLAFNLEKIKNELSLIRYQDIYEKLNATSSNTVDPERYSEQQSIGISRTATHNLETEDEARDFLREIVKIVSKRAKYAHKEALTITLQLRDPSFVTINRSKTVRKATNDHLDIYDICVELFEKNWILDPFNPIRLIGVSLSNLVDENRKEYDLFHLDNINEEEAIKDVIDNLNNKYQKNVISKGIIKKNK